MRILIALALLFSAAIAIRITSPEARQPHSGPGPSRHTLGPTGDQWLNWSRSAQTGYVLGYYDGYRRGDSTGCEDTWEFFVARGVQINMAMPAEPAQNCLDVMSRWTQSNDSLVARITEYYESFPTDYIVPVPLVMDSLSDQKHMTFLQIHHWYVEGELQPKR
jgi:hypothetical protein